MAFVKQVPVYIINLEREERRRAFMQEQVERLGFRAHFIQAVDSRQMNEAELAHLADASSRKKFPNWLTPGAIACATSHRKAYETFLESDEDYALFLEDDVILPNDFDSILDDLQHVALTNEVLLLHFLSFKPLSFSRAHSRKCGTLVLHVPSDLGAPTTAAAYVLSRTTAASLVKYCNPVKVPADAWGHFYENGAIGGLLCALDTGLETAEFKSSIDYLSEDSLKGKIMQVIDRYKIPPFYQFLARRRKSKADAHRKAYTLVD